jgi:hypothetical protein
MAPHQALTTLRAEHVQSTRFRGLLLLTQFGDVKTHLLA